MGDVKPENMMLNKNGFLTFTDFGDPTVHTPFYASHHTIKYGGRSPGSKNYIDDYVAMWLTLFEIDGVLKFDSPSSSKLKNNPNWGGNLRFRNLALDAKGNFFEPNQGGALAEAARRWDFEFLTYLKSLPETSPEDRKKKKLYTQVWDKLYQLQVDSNKKFSGKEEDPFTELTQIMDKYLGDQATEYNLPRRFQEKGNSLKQFLKVYQDEIDEVAYDDKLGAAYDFLSRWESNLEEIHL